jgi:hypothetical protein
MRRSPPTKRDCDDIQNRLKEKGKKTQTALVGRKISNYCLIYTAANCSRAQNQRHAARHPRQSSLKPFPRPLDWQNLVCIPEVASDLGTGRWLALVLLAAVDSPFPSFFFFFLFGALHRPLTVSTSRLSLRLYCILYDRRFTQLTSTINEPAVCVLLLDSPRAVQFH